MSKLIEELEMGFISPTGEWLPVPFCEHEKKAFEILEKHNYETCLDATDTHTFDKFLISC